MRVTAGTWTRAEAAHPRVMLYCVIVHLAHFPCPQAHARRELREVGPTTIITTTTAEDAIVIIVIRLMVAA